DRLAHLEVVGIKAAPAPVLSQIRSMLVKPDLFAFDLEPVHFARFHVGTFPGDPLDRRQAGAQFFDRPLEINEILEERLDDGPGRDRRERADDQENHPVLVIPPPALVARDPGLAAQAHLSPEQIIDVTARRLLVGDADDAVRWLRIHGLLVAGGLVGSVSLLVSAWAAFSASICRSRSTAIIVAFNSGGTFHSATPMPTSTVLSPTWMGTGTNCVSLGGSLR